MISTTGITLQKPFYHSLQTQKTSNPLLGAGSTDTFTPSPVKFASRSDNTDTLIRNIIDSIIEKTTDDKLKWEYIGFPEFLPFPPPRDRSGYRFYQTNVTLDEDETIVFGYHTVPTKLQPTLYILPQDWQRTKAQPIATFAIPNQQKDNLIKLINPDH